ncbi:MAG TPA: hypothetical protein VN703_00475 [Candidatus Sulfopaludibacter sp.]|nr:hypothetical protein [Candidatus Sulfopaludibacter sp.]
MNKLIDSIKFKINLIDRLELMENRISCKSFKKKKIIRINKDIVKLFNRIEDNTRKILSKKELNLLYICVVFSGMKSYLDTLKEMIRKRENE